MKENALVAFESIDGEVSLIVNIEEDTVWLSQSQMAALFDTSKQNVSSHINNCFNEGELTKNSVVKESLTTAADGKKYRTNVYNLDVIISVGYRVKSQRGVEFRRWATDVLKRYLIEGYAQNDQRITQLGRVIEVMARIPASLQATQILDVLKTYTDALTLLDDYDRQTLAKPKGTRATYILEYEECRAFIESMHFANEGDLFGAEKDDSFKGCIGNIYQSFDVP